MRREERKKETGMSGNPAVPASFLNEKPKTVDEAARTGSANDHALHQREVMALYRTDDRRLLPTSKVGSEKRVAIWMSILVIAGCSVLCWALVISIAVALLRFGR
jgi:hypothetical protein